ncbi:MAG: glycosyltransferase family 2 protein [Verrucomicrobiota bacterium]
MLSFITAIYNCLDLTKAMLQTLEATVDLSKHEVILVDDASEPETANYLSTLSSPYRVVTNPTNEGFAYSNNRAAHKAKGDVLIFLNNDLELSPKWLEPMLDLLENAPQAGLIGNVQRNHATGLIDHAGIFFDLEGMPTHARKNRNSLPSCSHQERNAVTAACVAIKRSTFIDHGGFSQDYRNGMEDVDFSLRLKQAGYRHYVSYQSVIRHHISVSPGRHEHNDANAQVYRRIWPNYAKTLGQKEWHREYLARYARHWWKFDARIFTALRLFIKS